MKLLIRWAISAFSLFLAALLVPGIHISGNGWLIFFATAVILGLINALVRPVLKFFSFPLIIITFGLFTLVINALSLWIASYIAINWFNVGFFIDDFLSAFLGALIITIATGLLWRLTREKEDTRS